MFNRLPKYWISLILFAFTWFASSISFAIEPEENPKAVEPNTNPWVAPNTKTTSLDYVTTSTLQLYTEIIELNKNLKPNTDLCLALDQLVKDYLEKNTAPLKNHLANLASESSKLTESEKKNWASHIQHIFANKSEISQAQTILYQCLYKLNDQENKPKTYRFDRTLREFYNLHQTLLYQWLGNVD